jgi:hypothetical protein
MTHAAPPPLLGIQDDAVLSSSDPKAWSLVGALGAGVVRLQVIWPGPGKPIDWTATDRIVEGAASVGAEPLITISAGKPGANGTAHAPNTPTNATAFGDFCSQVALRYDGEYIPDEDTPTPDVAADPLATPIPFAVPLPRVDRYSVLNEPNRGQYVWPQGPSGQTAPRLAARLVAACLPALQDANPDAQVALGPLASRGAQGGIAPLGFLKAYRKAGGLQPDAVALNPYLDGLLPEYRPKEIQADGAITLRNLDQLETQLKVDYKRRVDVWLTEFAWRLGSTKRLGNVTAARQAKLTRDTLTLVRRYPYVRIFTWFLLRDESKGYWKSGLVGPDGQPRPAFRIWKQAEG